MLGIKPESGVKNNRKIIGILCTIAKKMITTLWLKPEPPCPDQWWERVLNVMEMERVTARLRFQTKKFENIWTPVIRETNI